MIRYTGKLIAVILALTLLMVAGCAGGKDEPAADTPADTPASTPKATQQPEPEETQAAAEKPDPYSPMPELVTLTTGTSLPAEPKYPEGESIENNDVLKWLKDNMNIEVKYEWTTSDQNNAFDERLGLLIASNEIPDFLFMGGPNSMHMLKQLIESDMIMEVTQLYDDYASPTLKEMHEGSGNVALKPVTFDGKLMAIPSLADMETAPRLCGIGRTCWIKQACSHLKL
jgi:putative aldouronate transport system substrate-binding protein